MVFTLHSIFTHRTAPLWQVLGQTMVNPTSYALEAISGGEPRAAAELVYYMLVDERAEAETAAAAAAAVRPSLSALTPVRAPIQLPDIKIDVISAKPRLVGTVLAAFNALDDLGDLCALAQACWERAMRLRPRLLSRVHELQDGPHVRPPTPTLTLLVPHLFS